LFNLLAAKSGDCGPEREKDSLKAAQRS
jgi:hypothetical protein